MPVLETAAISAVASGSKALIDLFRYSLQYAEIPEEVQQFRHAIDNLSDSINTSKRLRRIKSSYLDSATKSEVDNTITRSEKVLDNISRTIEECRADLQIEKTVTFKNRLGWLLQGHQAFMSRMQTLNSCMQTLSMQIGRMDAVAIAPAKLRMVQAQPPSYQDSLYPGQQLRAPSVRKQRSRLESDASEESVNSMDNKSTFSFDTEKESVITLQPPQRQHDEWIPAALFSVGDFDYSCAGDYCTDARCTNHERSAIEGAPITQTRSLGADSRYNVAGTNSGTSSTSSIPFDGSTMRPSSQRRRVKSGFV